MKKSILVLLMLITSLCFYSNTVSAQSKIENKNGLIIKLSEYDKLISMGYTEEEIYNFTENDYNKHDLANIVVVSKETSYYRTSRSNEKSSREKISKKEYYDSLSAEEDLLPDTSVRAITPIGDLPPGGGGGGDVIITENSEDTQNHFYFSVTITLSYNITQDSLFSKGTMIWDNDPGAYLFDALSLTHDSDIAIDKIDYGSNQYSEFDVHLIYDTIIENQTLISLGVYETTTTTATTYKSFDENPVDTEDSLTYINNSLYGIGIIYDFQYEFPNYDLLTCTEWNQELSICQMWEEKTLGNLTLSLEAYFHRRDLNFASAVMVASYRHQHTYTSVEITDLSISDSPPYLNFEVAAIEQTYESEIFAAVECLYEE
ncbi:MAG: hypothetical protein KAU02_01930 [Tenericutes bacterium]|nr:hypothetical protein [Mycoplasmatota bacterium]